VHPVANIVSANIRTKPRIIAVFFIVLLVRGQLKTHKKYQGLI
jgi:hypothetical protein